MIGRKRKQRHSDSAPGAHKKVPTAAADPAHRAAAATTADAARDELDAKTTAGAAPGAAPTAAPASAPATAAPAAAASAAAPVAPAPAPAAASAAAAAAPGGNAANDGAVVVLVHERKFWRVPVALKTMLPEQWGTTYGIASYPLSAADEKQPPFAVVPHDRTIVVVRRRLPRAQTAVPAAATAGATIATGLEPGLCVLRADDGQCEVIPAPMLPAGIRVDWRQTVVVQVEQAPTQVAREPTQVGHAAVPVPMPAIVVLMQTRSHVLVEWYDIRARQATACWAAPYDSQCVPLLKVHRAPFGLLDHSGALRLLDLPTGTRDVLPPVMAPTARDLLECGDDGALVWADATHLREVGRETAAMSRRNQSYASHTYVYVPATREFAYIIERWRTLKESMSRHHRGLPICGTMYGIGLVHRDTGRHRWTWLQNCETQPLLNARLYHAGAVVISEPAFDAGYIVHSAINNSNGRPVTTRTERMQCDCLTLTRA